MSPTATLNDLRLSTDSPRSSADLPTTTTTTNGVNGHGDDPVARLEAELKQVREEKDTLSQHYSTLVQKLTQMRTTLGNKLKQDAEELDRREQSIQQLEAQNEDLATTVETLREELVHASDETARVSIELDTLRSRALQDNAQESLMRERELRETQVELERCRMERDEWERVATQEKAFSDDSRMSLETLRQDLEMEREARMRDATELEAEREKADNLQSVLQDFQTAKEHELRQAVKDYDSQLTQVTQQLAEFKHRAHTAELSIEETHTNSTRTQELEKEVKEKNLLIGKLRHEAVIMNEHLMEALRRLRRNSNDTNVDRRLVTNILLQFLNTPRADAKRFEMLTLLATILSWSDGEREKAGLQRSSGSAPSPSTSFWSRPSLSASSSTELQKTDETESFSRLWVEFLMTEAGEQPSSPSRNGSAPSTPTRTSFSPSPAMRRLPSLGSTPDLALPVPPNGKGKEREV
ncbi:hypothetical protein CYLTODRAFT_358100 [Cylindrobasidium torrendii FP15055 ss-10]|uniref:GRIP domain-containing protein n=1 Tax=Cylindrobasidium torrendii FP15055 ss-10 TaxID=1314674 RepID=A0A0D7B550_9AGAR|nr:hypothetical protein CYLTODRAFT_358100 [Cylindrobasidium torrendii FP15055 ss-10]